MPSGREQAGFGDGSAGGGSLCHTVAGLLDTSLPTPTHSLAVSAQPRGWEEAGVG